MAKRRLFGMLFMAGLRLNAWLTRSPGLAWIEARILTPAFVRLTLRMRGARPVERTPDALGREWERLLASRRTAHITQVVGDTALGEIAVACPLRGTGDLHACHRLMAYDRALVARHGGQLVVLASQADPSVDRCRIAIRAADADVSDLIPAHRVVRTRTG